MHYLFQSFHHHIGGVVSARAKGHSRVNFNHMLACSRSIFLPARLDNQGFAHMCHMKILLPFISPILLGQLAEARVAKAILPNALFHSLQLGLDLSQTLLKLIIIGIIATHSYNLSILLLRNVAQLPSAAVAQIVYQLRVLNRYALGASLRQNFGHNLHCFMRYRHIHFNPIIHLYRKLLSLFIIISSYYTLSCYELYRISVTIS